MREEFLAEVEAFLVETKMPATQFGKDACKDPNFIRELRDGRNVSMGIAEKVKSFMAQSREKEAARADEAA